MLAGERIVRRPYFLFYVLFLLGSEATHFAKFPLASGRSRLVTLRSQGDCWRQEVERREREGERAMEIEDCGIRDVLCLR